MQQPPLIAPASAPEHRVSQSSDGGAVVAGVVGGELNAVVVAGDVVGELDAVVVAGVVVVVVVT